MRLSPLGNVADRRLVPACFALALTVVYSRNFQGPGLRKHPGVGLEPIGNGADWLPLSLVNPSLSDLLSSSSLQGGVVDIVFGILWKWAKRRHPNKGARWVKDRHFQRIGSRKWEFSSDGTTKHCLYTTASTTIRRHVKTKGQANPFHPDWDPYFAKRKQTAKIRRELDTYLGGTIGKQCVRGRLPALEASRAS